MKKLVSITMAVCLLLVGCNTLNKVVVTICDAEDAAMREWADAHNKGLTSIELDKKVDSAHQNFNKVKMSTKRALEVYKQTGQDGDYLQAIATARAAAQGVLDLLVDVVSAQRQAQLKSMLKSANTIGGN